MTKLTVAFRNFANALKYEIDMLLSQNPENAQITRLATEKPITEVQFGVSNAGLVVMVVVLVVMMVVVEVAAETIVVVVVVVLLLLLLLLLLYDMDVSCHKPFFPGTSLEPAVNPTTQASSFALLHIAVLSVLCVMFQV
jgi:hypothetical protein